jgi:imidazolonepropionase-like amidohydrolase
MPERIIIKGSWLWDGTGSTLFPDPLVVIEDGLLKHVAKTGETGEIAGARVHSFPGATLLPGLIDCHTHLSMDPTLENYLDRMSDAVPVQTLRAVTMMKKDLKAGITTCRCLGDKEFLDIACRSAVESGELAGPHLLVATRGIRAPHGHGFVGYPFAGVEAIKAAIGQNVRAGADLIKIYITGTLKGNGDLPSFLSYEEIKTAIDTAHQMGRPVASHCVGGHGLDWALDLGLDTLEHAYHISNSQIERLAKSDTWLVLTPSPMLTKERIDHLPQSLIPGHEREKEMIFANMAKTVTAGFPFAVGSDGMHGDLVSEIEYLVELGASAERALQAATSNAAKAVGIEQTRGTIEPGKWADILVVQGNPLQDTAALRKVKTVFKKGQIQIGL